MPNFTSAMSTGLEAIDLSAVLNDISGYAGLALGLLFAVKLIPFAKQMANHATGISK